MIGLKFESKTRCSICHQEIDPYDLPVILGKSQFHRSCFNHQIEKPKTQLPFKDILLTFLVLGPVLFFFKPLPYILGLALLGMSAFLLKDLPGIEFATLATALAGVNFGSVVGALVGFISTVPFYWKGSFLTLFSSLGFVAVGVLASHGFGFILLGILCPLVYHLIVDGASVVIYGVEEIWASIPFTIFHLGFNCLIFYLCSLYII